MNLTTYLPQQRQSIAWLFASVISGVAAAALLLVQLAQPAADPAQLPEIRLLGQPLALDQDAPERALNRLRAHVGGLMTLTLPDNQSERVSFGELGVEIDKIRLGQQLRDAVDRTSPMSRFRRRNGVKEPLVLPPALRLDRAKALPTLLRIKDEFDRSAMDARLDLEARSVLPSRVGLLLDIDRSLLAIESALETGSGEAELVFEQLQPARKTEELNNVRFDHVISSFETPYDRSRRSAARTYNLRQAASKLDGYVLLPGEIFDFNRVVGPRDEANGYKVALVIAEGELVDGIGGGTCQVSGTLHGAAFFAGLDIVERYAHTRPSSYIKLGLDATVVYPTITYRIRNPHEFPVVLHETVKDGLVRAEVLGPLTKTSVTLIRRIHDAIPYDEQERPTPSLARGARRLLQRGVAGFKVRMYRVTQSGSHAVRERFDSIYPPSSQIIAVGTGEAEDKRAPKNDPHEEYTADELLVLTLRPGGTESGPRYRESREPGRFGQAGWTREMGMPQFADN